MLGAVIRPPQRVLIVASDKALWKPCNFNVTGRQQMEKLTVFGFMSHHVHGRELCEGDVEIFVR